MSKITIIGAGLCGTLLALRMAQRGHTVDLFEKRDDLRKEKDAAGRSINLALSSRGLKALALVGIKDDILDHCIPMYGRQIHFLNGDERFSKYSARDNEYINSVSRSGLNGLLLNKAENHENIKIHFQHQCVFVDIDQAIAKFKTNDGAVHTITSDVLIGTDGAGSVVRKSLMKSTTRLLFNYSQHFLRHGYKELSIRPGKNGECLIKKNALHIWPRGKFMIIALPNLDGSFTVTMFHPFGGEFGFEALNSKEKVLTFFKKEFPDLVTLIPHLTEEYFENPTGTLGTIKCYPWQVYGKTLIMGDASHAIVPFYGQGMNASFEDVVVFDKSLDKFGNNWEKVFYDFQENRVKDANAIADLALDNFIEMQDHVADPNFIKKRNLEMKLETTFPEYRSKYSHVTFNPEMPYHKAKALGRKQDELLLDYCKQGLDETLDLKEIFKVLQQLQS